MNDEDLIRPILLVLGVASMFLISTSIAVAMARDGLVLWTDANYAVRGLSIFSTVMVALVGLGRTLGRKRGDEEPTDRR